MTVKEFKQLVADIPTSQDNWIVVISKDEEGNGFNECTYLSNDDDEICTRYYDTDEGVIRHYNEDDYENWEEFEEFIEEYPHLKSCIVLWP